MPCFPQRPCVRATWSLGGTRAPPLEANLAQSIGWFTSLVIASKFLLILPAHHRTGHPPLLFHNPSSQVRQPKLLPWELVGHRRISLFPSLLLLFSNYQETLDLNPHCKSVKMADADVSPSCLPLLFPYLPLAASLSPAVIRGEQHPASTKFASEPRDTQFFGTAHNHANATRTRGSIRATLPSRPPHTHAHDTACWALPPPTTMPTPHFARLLQRQGKKNYVPIR